VYRVRAGGPNRKFRSKSFLKKVELKRVLLIAYAYPPCPEIGAVRPAGLASICPATAGNQPS
jgi:hypothetical protein